MQSPNTDTSNIVINIISTVLARHVCVVGGVRAQLKRVPNICLVETEHPGIHGHRLQPQWHVAKERVNTLRSASTCHSSMTTTQANKGAEMPHLVFQSPPSAVRRVQGP